MATWRRALTVLPVLLVVAGCNKSSSSGAVSTDLISSEIVTTPIQDRSLVADLHVQTAYNTTDGIFFWKFSFDGNRGNTHDFYTFSATTGTWKKDGKDQRNATSPTQTLSSENRVTIALNDPSSGSAVPNFGLYGCFLACHDQSHHMPGWAELGRSDEVGMGLPESDPFYAGGVLDLWHWRGHRSNPTGSSDDQNIDNAPAGAPGAGGGGRHGDAGTGPYSSGGMTGGNPDFVQDPATTASGNFAFPFSSLTSTPDYYMTRDGSAQPFELAWATALTQGYVPADGDTVPRRRLRVPTGSRGDISATIGAQVSAYDATTGRWNVYLQRAMNTLNPDDVAFVAGQSYEAAFGIFVDNTANRDHYVSLPQTIGLGVPSADIQAVALTGIGVVPDFSDTATYPIKIVQIFLPGIASYEYLTSTQTTSYRIGTVHGGYVEVSKSIGGLASVACSTCHVVKASDPAAGSILGGDLETKVVRRGGVLNTTPVSYSKAVVAALQGRCFSCHNDTGTASAFSMGASSVDEDKAYLLIRGVASNFITYTDATLSPMLVLPGTDSDGNHPAAGPLVGFSGSQDYQRILYWILFGAPQN